MSDDDLILKLGNLIDQKLEPVKKDLQEVKATQQTQGKQITEQGKKLDTLLAEAAHTRTAIKTLDNKIDATKTELDEIKQRQRPRHAD